MMLGKVLTAASVFVVCLLNRPVSLAAGRGKKRRNGTARSRLPEGESARAAAKEGVADAEAPLCSKEATRKTHSGAGKPTNAEGSGARKTLGNELSQVQKMLSAVKETVACVQEALAAVGLNDQFFALAATHAPLSSPKGAGSRLASVKRKHRGAPARAQAVSPPGPAQELAAADKEAASETRGACCAAAGVPALEGEATASDREGTDTASAASIVDDTDEAGRTPPYSTAAESVSDQGLQRKPDSPAARDRGYRRFPNAAVLLRRQILVADLADAMTSFCSVYRIRGGTDVNEIRLLLQRGCSLLHAMMITDKELWTEDAAETLRFGRKTLHALDVRDPSFITGTARQLPQLSQIVRTRPVYRVRAVERDVEELVETMAKDLYEQYLRSVGAPLEVRRNVMEQIDAAELRMRKMREEYEDVWYLYAEFMYTWLRVKQAKVRAQLVDEDRSLKAEP